MTARDWLQQHLIAWDQLINTVFKGMADETLSARCWRNRNKSRLWGVTRRVVDAVFAILESDHCYHAYRSEMVRKHLPGEYRASVNPKG